MSSDPTYVSTWAAAFDSIDSGSAPISGTLRDGEGCFAEAIGLAVVQLSSLDVPGILRAALKGFVEDNALSRAAAMSFYATTSLAPILLIVIAIAGLAVGRDVAQLAVAAQLSGLLGPAGADLLKSIVEGAANTSSGVLAATFATTMLIVTASGVFGEMQASLNQIWKVKPPSTELSGLVRARVASLGLVASMGFLLLVSLAASAAISAFSDILNRHLPFGTLLASTINTVVSASLIAILFAAIYKILPDRSLSWREVRLGAVTTAILFTIGKSLIGWYLGTSAVASSYGAAGNLIVLLLWVFYSSVIFLFGAEITRSYATTHTGMDVIVRHGASAPHQRTIAQEAFDKRTAASAAFSIAVISFTAALTASCVGSILRRRH